MKKKFVKTILLITAVFLTGCGAAGAKPVDEITLKIGVSTGESDPRNIAAAQFAQEIEEKSGGKIKAKVYPSGEIGGDAEMIDLLAVDSDKIDIVISDASNFANHEPKMGISALPFLFEDFDEAWAFMDSDIEAEAEELLQKDNMHVLAHYCNGFRCLTNSKLPVNSPDDMKGLIIRTPENPIIMATMSALGANPQPLSFSELYTALEHGSYDGQENPVPVIYNNKLYEVQKYLSVTNHIYSGMCFTIKESLWQRFSDEQKEIIQNAALNSAESDRESNRSQTESLLSSLEEEGMQISTPDLEPFTEKTQSVLSSNAKDYGELYDKLVEWKKSR